MDKNREKNNMVEKKKKTEPNAKTDSCGSFEMCYRPHFRSQDSLMFLKEQIEAVECSVTFLPVSEHQC